MKKLQVQYLFPVSFQDVQRELDYVMKEDTRVDFGQVFTVGEIPVFSSSKKMADHELFKALLAMDSVEEAIAFLREKDPVSYVLRHASIESCLCKEFRKKEVATHTKFNLPFQDVNDGCTHIFVGALVLARLIMLSHFDSPVLVSDHQDFARISVATDGIVIDDMSFKSWSAVNVLHILDVAFSRTVNVKYGAATIPAGLPRIITTNGNFIFIFSLFTFT